MPVELASAGPPPLQPAHMFGQFGSELLELPELPEPLEVDGVVVVVEVDGVVAVIDPELVPLRTSRSPRG